MSIDRILTWDKERPSDRQIGFVVRDYFHAAGSVYWDFDRWFAKLPGVVSHPLKRIEDAVWRSEQAAGERDRWVEVVVSKDGIDILTRQQDDFTNALADGLAEVFKRYWKPTTNGTLAPEEGHGSQG